jgi:hypothetical protein
MQCTDLLEATHSIDKSALFHTQSNSILAQEYTRLSQKKLHDVLYDSWYSESRGLAICTSPIIDEFGERTNQILEQVNFQNPSELPVKNPLHVKEVHVYVRVPGMALTPALYTLLIARGFTIVSDFTQGTGGKELWKRLAKSPSANNFKVQIWDTKNKDWFMDNTKQPICHSAENLSDDKTWTNIYKQYKSTTLLVLTHK